MDNALVVGVVKRVNRLVDERQRGFGGARSSGLNALHEFRHDGALFDAVDAGDIGMMPTCREVIEKYAIIPARRPSQVAGGGGLDGVRADQRQSPPTFRMRRDLGVGLGSIEWMDCFRMGRHPRPTPYLIG